MLPALLQGGWSQPTCLLVLAPVLRAVDPWFGMAFQSLVAGLLGGLFWVTLASAAPPVEVLLLEASLLQTEHLQTEPYHFTIVTYLQQAPPLPPVAILNRSSYCVFETFPDVDKLVLAQSNILASSLY